MAKYNEVTMGQMEACINRMGGMAPFLRFIGGSGEVVFNSIMTFLRTQLIAPLAAITASEEYFGEVEVKWMGDNFKAQFLGLELPCTERAEMKVAKLEKSSLDALILAELGDKAEITVSQFREFLGCNCASPEWFIFYLRGKDGNLWAVLASWSAGGGGWRVEALSVADPDGWLADGRVVSRN